MSEIWKSVVGWEGYYEVSSLGRVRSVDRIATDGSHRRGKLRKLVPIGADRAKYLSVVLSRGSKVKCIRVHTEMLRAFRRAARPGEEGRHLDGNTRNNRLANLQWGTPRQNTTDKHRHGTVPKGARHWNARLTEANVRAIRSRLARGDKQRDIGVDFGVLQQQISRIATRARWA